MCHSHWPTPLPLTEEVGLSIRFVHRAPDRSDGAQRIIDFCCQTASLQKDTSFNPSPFWCDELLVYKGVARRKSGGRGAGLFSFSPHFGRRRGKRFAQTAPRKQCLGTRDGLYARPCPTNQQRSAERYIHTPYRTCTFSQAGRRTSPPQKAATHRSRVASHCQLLNRAWKRPPPNPWHCLLGVPLKRASHTHPPFSTGLRPLRQLVGGGQADL